MLIRAPDTNAWMGFALIVFASFILVAIGYATAVIP